MKKLLKIIIGIFLIILILFLLRSVIANIAVSNYLKSVTGLTLDIQKLYIGVFDSKLDVIGLKLYNPKEYPEKLMLDLPQVYVEYNLPELLKGKIHLKEAKINLNEFVVVKIKENHSNLDALKPFQPKEEKNAKKQNIQIDKLDLTITKVVVKDFSSGNKPLVTEFKVNIREQYENISDINTLTNLIVVKALANTTVGNIVNLKAMKNDLKSINTTVGEIKGTFKKIIIK